MQVNQNKSFSLDALETRTLCSATPVAPSVVGYLPDYEYSAVLNQNTGKLDKLNWNALTQINYFSLVPDGDTGALPTVSSDNRSLSQLTQVVTEAHQHGVKVSIVIGGAGLDGSLTTIAADADLRTNFAQGLQAFANQYHIDGVDLDWELQHPTLEQIDNYGLLIETVRNNTSGLKLSAAVYPEKLSIATVEDPTGGNWDTFA